MKLNGFSSQNTHELIAKRGDLTERVENRAFAPSVDFYPRGGADDLETRELEEFWLIARGVSFFFCPIMVDLILIPPYLKYRTTRYRKSSTY